MHPTSKKEQWLVHGPKSSEPKVSSAIVFIAIMTPKRFVERKHGVFSHTWMMQHDMDIVTIGNKEINK